MSEKKKTPGKSKGAKIPNGWIEAIKVLSATESTRYRPFGALDVYELVVPDLFVTH